MPAPLPRSPELMNADDTALLVVDVQERLAPAVRDPARLTWNCGRLLQGAAALGVPAAATEQYPEKLGPTVPELTEHLAGSAAAKLMFSCRECGDLLSGWQSDGRERVLLAGIETHVCIQQTALDLLAAGFRVYVAVDAVSSRREVDHQTALRRMESAGATLTTTEAALFEWCVEAGTAPFKAISALAKQAPPE
ncbi:putative isochorismatase [Posidoniimonas corsicana]|uniref:Putative isochorismatase n=1 Tax=Posidoniimonas corsicana TaxID=1938618 RepID=A0A5C5VCR5_9BACT|nr:hydrolase [Posidoniimonas corsicana]TWT36414.1 putative isochorismatase [Posidoniimonas corsicana]